MNMANAEACVPRGLVQTRRTHGWAFMNIIYRTTNRRSGRLSGFLLSGLVLGACVSRPGPRAALDRPDVSPRGGTASDTAIPLETSQIKPMHTELVSIDLPTVVRVTIAQNTDIVQARLNVTAREGGYESTVGAAFPAIVPTALFEHVEGSVRATEGNIVGVGFNSFQPSVAVQWIVNPGRVMYEIVAAKKRLSASEHLEEVVVATTLRDASVQFYALVLAQTRISAAQQGVQEATELLRVNRLRLNTGTGVQADVLRAEARLAERQQDLVTALKEFYDGSVDLAVTLHLDSSVTLVPALTKLEKTQLVRGDLALDELLGIAVVFRPELENLRSLMDAAIADRKKTWWSGFGPTLSLAYQYGGITGHANNVVAPEGIPGNLILNPASSNGSFSNNPFGNGLIKEGILRGSKRLDGRDDQTYSFSDQQRATAAAGWRLSLSTLGDLKTASAFERQTVVRFQRLLDEVRAETVAASQATRAYAELIEFAKQQVASAEEALRLSQANLQVGTMTTLDVLQAQDAATQARLRFAAAVVRYNQSQIRLLAALGLFSESSVGASSSIG